MPSIVSRVSAGARLLDEEEPFWFLRVDSEDLKMGSTSACILGQTFKNAIRPGSGLDGFDVGVDQLNLTTDETVEYGFDAKEGAERSESEEYDRLAFYWRGQIGRRLIKYGESVLRGLK